MWGRITILGLLATQLSFGQTDENDSLRKLIVDHPSDTLGIKAHLDIAWNARYSDVQLLREHGKIALDLSKRLNYKPGIVLGLKTLGVGEAIAGNNRRALSTLQEALLMAKSYRQDQEIAILYNAIGVSFHNLGIYEKALEYYLKAASELEVQDDSAYLGKVYNNIGQLYTNNEQVDLSNKYFRKSLEVKRHLDDQQGIAVTYNNIGINHQVAGQLDSALYFFEEGLEISVQLHDINNQARLRNNIGEVYFDRGELDLAQVQYLKALQLKEQMGDRKSQITTHNNLGRLYLKQGQYAKATECLEQGVQMAIETESRPELKDGYGLLASVYQSVDDYRQAYLFRSRADSLNRELQDEEKNRVLLELQTKYELQSKELEIAALNQQNALFQSNLDKQRVILILAAAGLVLLAVLVVLFYRVNINNRRTNKMLSQQKSEIEAINQNLIEINDQKNSLIGIVAHDLRSPLNQIQGLVDLLRLNPNPNSDEPKDWITKIDQSVKRMNSLITRILDVEALEANLRPRELKEIDLSVHLKEAIEEFQSKARSKDITLKSEGPKEAMVWSNSDSLRQVLSNLISNAVKFSPTGKVVHCNVHEFENAFQVEIRDQGPGIPESELNLLFKKFQRLTPRPTAKEDTTGLGLYIVKKYMESMDGEVWCRSTEGKGASFFIQLTKA